MKKNILAIIPARAGSKGIKNKNIISIHGKPLISYTIKSAKKSKLITNLIGSTDSIKIKKIFEKYNVDVPFLRPKKLATDKSLIIKTLFFCLKKMEKINKKKYEYIILLQPTAPNREKNEIDSCINKIIKKKADSLISLSLLDEPHPYKLKKISKGFAYDYLKNGKNNYPRQSLPKLYKPSGNIYIFKRKIIINKNLNTNNQTYSIVEKEKFLNIDNNDDLSLAKLKLKK
jgi:CMP-N,N'-diacetyllegionaminic acid synthase